MEWPESTSMLACSAHSCIKNRKSDVLNDPDCNAFIQFLGLLCSGPVIASFIIYTAPSFNVFDGRGLVSVTN